MSEQAPRSLDERTQFEYQDVKDYMEDDIAAQRREQAMAVYDGDRAAAKNASARARRREQKLEQMEALQDQLGAMDKPYVGKHERRDDSALNTLVHADDQETFDAEAAALDLPGVYSGDVFYNEASQTVFSIGESRTVGSEEVVRVVTETKLANGKTKKTVRELPRAKAEAFAESLDVALIEPGYERIRAAESTDEYEDTLESNEQAPVFEQGSYIMWNNELYVVDSVGDLSDQGERFMRLIPAYGNNPQPIDTTERALLEADATLAPESELDGLDFANGMDAIKAELIAGTMTIEAAKEAVKVLGEQTNRPQDIVDYAISMLQAFLAMEPQGRPSLDDYKDLFVQEPSTTTTTGPKTLSERLREARRRPLVDTDDTDAADEGSIVGKIKDAPLRVVANAQAALNVAAEKAASATKEKHNKRRRYIYAGIGLAAVAAVLYAGNKYGWSFKPNAEAAQAAQEAAEKTTKHVDKLTKIQEQLISAPGKYPYGHYEHVYGADAAEQLHKAVRRLHAAGVKVIEHGSGKDYWIEVPTKNGTGMTANTKRVVEVLATGRV